MRMSDQRQVDAEVPQDERHQRIVEDVDPSLGTEIVRRQPQEERAGDEKALAEPAAAPEQRRQRGVRRRQVGQQQTRASRQPGGGRLDVAGIDGRVAARRRWNRLGIHLFDGAHQKQVRDVVGRERRGGVRQDARR